MELQLELALSTTPVTVSDPNQNREKRKKRAFEEAFSVHVPLTLPLFIRQDESNRNGEVKEDFGVGWPPVKSRGKELCHRNRRRFVNIENGGGGGRRSNSKYVKVKMEGVGIMRKVDLSIHSSYPTLFAHFASLFGICEEEKYKLIYQNKEGHWLHASDVPWESFIGSVQRLKLEKNSY